jgi:hypothetical protein
MPSQTRYCPPGCFDCAASTHFPTDTFLPLRGPPTPPISRPWYCDLAAQIYVEEMAQLSSSPHQLTASLKIVSEKFREFTQYFVDLVVGRARLIKTVDKEMEEHQAIWREVLEVSADLRRRAWSIENGDSAV